MDDESRKRDRVGKLIAECKEAVKAALPPPDGGDSALVIRLSTLADARRSVPALLPQ